MTLKPVSIELRTPYFDKAQLVTQQRDILQ